MANGSISKRLAIYLATKLMLLETGMLADQLMAFAYVVSALPQVGMLHFRLAARLQHLVMAVSPDVADNTHIAAAARAEVAA